MNFEITKNILDTLSPYINAEKVIISTENKDWKGNLCKSDFVTIDSTNNVGFEVFGNEIIVFYFTDHHHFYADEESTFPTCAIEFLTQLFTTRLRCIETYKGKKLVKDYYYFVYDNKDDQPLGGTFYSLISYLNPFTKKTQKRTTWIYEKEIGQFTSRPLKQTNPVVIEAIDINKDDYIERPLKQISPDAIEVIDINNDYYIEIFKSKNAYTFNIMKIEYDEYNGWYYWAPLQDGKTIGLYDTKEKAIEYAMQEIGVSRQLKYEDLFLENGKLQLICDDDEDMLTITYNDGMTIDVGYIDSEKTYYITVLSSDDENGWQNPIEIIEIYNKNDLLNAIQNTIYKYRQ